MKLDILYEDDSVICLNKRAGVPSQSDKSFDEDMVSAVLTYRKKKGEDGYCALINRLDKPVHGIILMAKNKTAAGKLSVGGIYNKIYTAMVEGTMDESGILTDYIVKDGKTNTSRIACADEKDAKKASLEYKVIDTMEYNDKIYSIVRIRLNTGRHHQIRVQFSSRGHALYGDQKYGNGGYKRGVNIALCASELEFYHPVTGKRIILTVTPDFAF